MNLEEFQAEKDDEDVTVDTVAIRSGGHDEMAITEGSPIIKDSWL